MNRSKLRIRFIWHFYKADSCLQTKICFTSCIKSIFLVTLHFPCSRKHTWVWFNHIGLESRSDGSINRNNSCMVFSVWRKHILVVIPKFPNYFCTYNVLTRLEIEVDWANLVLRSWFWPNIDHIVSNFLEDDESSLRVLVVGILTAHFSFVFLINGNNILTRSCHLHLEISRLVSISLHSYWIMHKGRIKFADNYFSEIFSKISPAHVKRPVFRAIVIVILISEFFCPFCGFKRPISFPNQFSPWISQLHNSLSFYFKYL